MIKMRDGRHLRCVHNNPQGGHLPDYAPHPAIVLKMEDGTGLLLPIIVRKFLCNSLSGASVQKASSSHIYLFLLTVEMPSVLLMAAVRNVQIVCFTISNSDVLSKSKKYF